MHRNFGLCLYRGYLARIWQITDKLLSLLSISCNHKRLLLGNYFAWTDVSSHLVTFPGYKSCNSMANGCQETLPEGHEKNLRTV